MIRSTVDTYRFHLGRPQYKRVFLRGCMFLGIFLACAILALTLSFLLWRAYTHTFTPYLKWQDALVALLWFVTFVALSGSTFVIRFLFALRSGYTDGMVTLEGRDTLTVRDLSSENLVSILWMMNSAFWCFVAVLVGLVPVILIGWTLHIGSLPLAILSTGIAIIMSLAGFAVSIIAAAFIVIGCIGAVSFCRKLGSSHIYALSSNTTLRIDNFVLTIIYPGYSESMVELELLDAEDQRCLLSLLRERWLDAHQVWNPTLGQEIQQALEYSEQIAVPV